jgi:hypothetical protein
MLEEGAVVQGLRQKISQAAQGNQDGDESCQTENSFPLKGADDIKDFPQHSLSEK